MSQAAGSGNGAITLSTKFFVEGDFTATVSANRAGMGSVEVGLDAVFGSGSEFAGTADVFFVRQSRVGTTIFAEVDAGSGFTTLHSRSDAAFAKPAQFDLFLIQEFGSTAGNQAAFDNWTIVADSIPAVPEASTWVLLACGLLALRASTRRRGGSAARSTEVDLRSGRLQGRARLS